MKAWLRGFRYSFPIQLLFLHIRKYQVLLLFWFVLFSVVNGSLMKDFGADSLFLAPEYLGNINPISFSIVGVAFGTFVMSWNIGTFILHSRHFRFLAATTNPFLKYCINNSILPILFLIFYFFKAYDFARTRELISRVEILFLVGGFLAGLILILVISFIYFFNADRTILRRMMPVISKPDKYITHLQPVKELYADPGLIRVDLYFDTFWRIRPTRNVKHYTTNFVDSLFKRHHFAAVITVFIAFLALVIIGFFLENPLMQIPAAASITLFFTILIGIAATFSYFLQSWSLICFILLILAVNKLYQWEWIDPRNKAYGLNYDKNIKRPVYSPDSLLSLCTPEKVTADSMNMISVLENWKEKQGEEKPLMVMMATSGGGHRSATFTMSVLQYLDSITNGEFMKKTFLINGASGGMIGATYFRELYRLKMQGHQIDLQDKKYVDDISEDLLNAVFSSFVARDLMAPAQKFSVNKYRYLKDRGFAFEQKMNENTRGLLNKELDDYAIDEKEAKIPLIFFNSVITRDSRKMLLSTQPVSFMMRPWQDTARMPYNGPDIIDFSAFFKTQHPQNLRILTALRMNATFPVVLPNVWLPSDPVIDVMDAGLRDNYGIENTLRFLSAFDQWIAENTRGVLIVQMRDRSPGGWEFPFLSNDITDHATKPFLVLQHNWFKMMEYFQQDMQSYYTKNNKIPVTKALFFYATNKKGDKAALSFHLSEREKRDIIQSVQDVPNQKSFQLVKSLVVNDSILNPN